MHWAASEGHAGCCRESSTTCDLRCACSRFRCWFAGLGWCRSGFLSMLWKVAASQISNMPCCHCWGRRCRGRTDFRGVFDGHYRGRQPALPSWSWRRPHWRAHAIGYFTAGAVAAAAADTDTEAARGRGRRSSGFSEDSGCRSVGARARQSGIGLRVRRRGAGYVLCFQPVDDLCHDIRRKRAEADKHQGGFRRAHQHPRAQSWISKRFCDRTSFLVLGPLRLTVLRCWGRSDRQQWHI
mmetsp:Transcript_73996/g.199469  ORF Transcript_73996/g.199469 Transcript_73996/m.199469 type:complete len:239 (-) Transcript_73996:65-781(-)